MGGLVARAHVASRDPVHPYRVPANFNEGSIHKLITVGTPHLGSPLADALVAYKCEVRMFGIPGTPIAIPVSLEDLFGATGRPIGPGVYGLQTSSYAIANLDRTLVSAHAILGSAPGISPLEAGLDAIILAYIGTPLIDARLGPGHDVIVPYASQQGGLGLAAQSPTADPVVHTEETGSIEILDRILALLIDVPVASGFASGIPAHPLSSTPIPDLPCSASANSAAPLVASSSAGAVSILPSAGTVVEPGADVGITFEIGDDNPVDGAVISFGDVVEVVDGVGPFTVDLPAPTDALGSVDITAFTFGPGPLNYLAMTSVLVETNVVLLTLDPLREQVRLRAPGETRQLDVVGEYADGETRTLTAASAGTSYATDSGTTDVVSVDGEGVVTAMAEGRELVVIANGAQSTAVEIIVDYPECADGLDNDGDGGIDWNGSPADPECVGGWQDDESTIPAPEPGVVTQLVVGVIALLSLLSRDGRARRRAGRSQPAGTSSALRRSGRRHWSGCSGRRGTWGRRGPWRLRRLPEWRSASLPATLSRS